MKAMVLCSRARQPTICRRTSQAEVVMTSKPSVVKDVVHSSKRSAVFKMEAVRADLLPRRAVRLRGGCARQYRRPLCVTLRGNSVLTSRHRTVSHPRAFWASNSCHKLSALYVSTAILTGENKTATEPRGVRCSWDFQKLRKRPQICRSSSKDLKEAPKPSVRVRPLHVLKYFVFFAVGAGTLALLSVYVFIKVL